MKDLPLRELSVEFGEEEANTLEAKRASLPPWKKKAFDLGMKKSFRYSWIEASTSMNLSHKNVNPTTKLNTQGFPIPIAL